MKTFLLDMHLYCLCLIFVLVDKYLFKIFPILIEYSDTAISLLTWKHSLLNIVFFIILSLWICLTHWRYSQTLIPGQYHNSAPVSCYDLIYLSSAFIENGAFVCKAVILYKLFGLAECTHRHISHENVHVWLLLDIL